MFKELSKEKVSKVEEEISKKWQQMNLLEKSIETRRNSENFVFYDGPATANGMPGLHHMLAKFLKDSFCKYKTMQGYHVLRKIGWDTHGLPVEVQVEKEMGFHSKKDIEDFGIKEFNEKCRASVWENKEAFSDLTRKMGQLIDLDDPYITYKNDYIETEWWILKKFFDEGYFYLGHKILPYCPRCGTGLASHEVAQGYKEVPTDTVMVPMKVKGQEDTYFLAWTTTPWTLIANVALCVNPDVKYVKCLSKGHHFIVAKDLMSIVLGEDATIEEEYLGKDLEYTEYEQLLPFLEVDKKAFYVVCASYVTTEDGTGVVHIAPAFGQDDYLVGRKYDLPVLNPVGEDGAYNAGPWAGMDVFQANDEVIRYLKENDKLFKKQRIVHDYPHCWRCDTPLIYYAKPSWYIEVTKLRDRILEENKKVHWHPSYIGEKRFGNWLENLNDWAISRKRYWGTPLPLWICECGHKEMIGSRKELVEKAIEPIDENIELHRPYVDEVHLKCPKCGKTMERVSDVIDCWFDSGSMPFAQYHYPFENKELWESQFPADFICEGVDQTRGWFYSLLVISTFVKGCAPYKNVLVNDLLLDKYGKKMSKSKGNKVDPFELIEKYGADPIRWYLPYVSPVWTPLRFDEDGLKEVYSKFFNTLKNTYNFFALYANTDHLDPREFTVSKEELEEIDLWMLSRYHHLVQNVTTYYDEYDLTKVVHAITDFVNEDLSNWYIRRNRRRFWASELDASKKAVYKTTYDVLVGISKMIAPIVPFVSEEIYCNLTEEESVHLAYFPKADETYFNDILENKMEMVRTLISLGRNVREEVRIKVRQPIQEVILDYKNETVLGNLVDLLKEELNVKKVTFVTDLSQYMNIEVKPNFKICGKIFGANIRVFQEQLKNLSKEEIALLEQGEAIHMTVADREEEITSEMVEMRVSSKEGFNAAHDGNLFIVLDTTLTKELEQEGLARELISKVQQLRKNKDFDITDRITVYYDGPQEFQEMLAKFKEMIQEETLALELVEKKDLEEEYLLNGIDVKLDVEKRAE